MSRIPRDLDSTMWDLANRGDQQAAADFAERFPALSSEISSRLEAIQGLRGYGRSVTPTFVPAFKPRFRYKPPTVIRRYGATAAGLAVLAAASFYVSSNLLTPLPDIQMPVAAQPAPRPTPIRLSAPPPPQTETFVDNGPEPFKQHPERVAKPEPPAQAHVSFEKVPLLTALKAIADKASMELIIPANFPNPVVTIDLNGKDALDVMQQIGTAYGFSAFDEGGNKVLLIPAVDSAEPPQG